MSIDLQMMRFTAKDSLGCSYSLPRKTNDTSNSPVEVDQGYVLVQKLQQPDAVCCTTLKAVRFTNTTVATDWIPSAWSIALAIASVSDLARAWAGRSMSEPPVAEPVAEPEPSADPSPIPNVLELLTNAASESAEHLMEMATRMQQGSYGPQNLQTDINQCTARGWALATALAGGWVQARSEAPAGPTTEPPIRTTTVGGAKGVVRPGSYRMTYDILADTTDELTAKIPTFSRIDHGPQPDEERIKRSTVSFEVDGKSVQKSSGTITIPAKAKRLTVIVDLPQEASSDSALGSPPPGIYFGEVVVETKAGEPESELLTDPIMPAW